MSSTDDVPTPIVLGVFGILGFAALAVLSLPSPNLTSTAAGPTAGTSACPAGSARTPRQDGVVVRTEPGTSAPLLLNSKASAMLGRDHYHQVDTSTSVSVLSCSGDWVEIAVTEPDWLRHVTGWVPMDAVFRTSELSAAAQNNQSPFGTFNAEAARATAALSCHSPKITPAQFGDGALYGCIQGTAETAKYWINEDGANPGQVENVKVMWNNWTDDRGWGVHADRAEAEQMVRATAKLYAPELEEQLVAAYFDRSAKSWATKDFEIDYRWTAGPAIDEHLLTIRSN